MRISDYRLKRETLFSNPQSEIRIPQFEGLGVSFEDEDQRDYQNNGDNAECDDPCQLVRAQDAHLLLGFGGRQVHQAGIGSLLLECVDELWERCVRLPDIDFLW